MFEMVSERDRFPSMWLTAVDGNRVEARQQSTPIVYRVVR